MDYYDIEADVVFGTGHQVAALTDGAGGLAVRYLGTIEDSREAVHHHAVKAALDRYREVWHRPVHEVALEIDGLGNNTSASAVVVAHSDQDSATLLAQQATVTEAQTAGLTRPVNGVV